jgi:hypothetical protein
VLRSSNWFFLVGARKGADCDKSTACLKIACRNMIYGVCGQFLFWGGGVPRRTRYSLLCTSLKDFTICLQEELRLLLMQLLMELNYLSI